MPMSHMIVGLENEDLDFVKHVEEYIASVRHEVVRHTFPFTTAAQYLAADGGLERSSAHTTFINMNAIADDKQELSECGAGTVACKASMAREEKWRMATSLVLKYFPSDSPASLMSEREVTNLILACSEPFIRLRKLLNWQQMDLPSSTPYHEIVKRKMQTLAEGQKLVPSELTINSQLDDCGEIIYDEATEEEQCCTIL